MLVSLTAGSFGLGRMADGRTFLHQRNSPLVSGICVFVAAVGLKRFIIINLSVMNISNGGAVPFTPMRSTMM